MKTYAEGARGGSLGRGLDIGLLMVFAILLAAVLATASMKSASAHLLEARPSFNAYGNVVWKEIYPYTNYNDATRFGAGEWTNTFAGRPNIFHVSNADTGATVGHYDYYAENGYVAFWVPRDEIDHIKYNDYWMYYIWDGPDRYDKRQITATHEFGHSIKFAHASSLDANDDDYYRRESVMFPNVQGHFDAGGRGGVHRHDVFDFNNRYN